MESSIYRSKLLDFEIKSLKSLQDEIILLENDEKKIKNDKKVKSLEKSFKNKLNSLYKNISFWEKTQISRHPDRPHFLDYTQILFTDFIELHGDRYFGDDRALIGGLAKIKNKSIMLVGHEKGRGTEGMTKHNFGMANPEGYRKALRLFKLAEKYNLPIITLVDTPGAYPGIEAEERGQSEAIARNLQEIFSIEVPIITVITGEGGSGGALGIAIGNQIAMLQYSIYSVISPESCASILWRDSSKKSEAATALKNDANTALKNKVIDEIIKEPLGGAHRSPLEMAELLKKSLLKNLITFEKKKTKEIILLREEKFASIGV